MYICVYIHTHIYVYVYIYIADARSIRGTQPASAHRGVRIYIYSMYICIYIQYVVYIYIYIKAPQRMREVHSALSLLAPTERCAIYIHIFM